MNKTKPLELTSDELKDLCYALEDQRRNYICDKAEKPNSIDQAWYNEYVIRSKDLLQRMRKMINKKQINTNN